MKNLGIIADRAPGESGWEDGMDANLMRLDTITQLQVRSATLSDLPASPVEGDRYIAGPGSTGGWVDGHVAVYHAGAWVQFQPVGGWRALVEDTGDFLQYDSLELEWLPMPGAGSQGAGVEVQFTADANYPLGAAQGRHRIICLIDPSAVLTAQRDVTIPDVQWGDWVFQNSTAHPLRVKQELDSSGPILQPQEVKRLSVILGELVSS